MSQNLMQDSGSLDDALRDVDHLIRERHVLQGRLVQLERELGDILGGEGGLAERARIAAEARIASFAMEQLQNKPRGLTPAELADVARCTGFAPISESDNPRMASAAILGHLMRTSRAYRGASGKYALKKEFRKSERP